MTTPPWADQALSLELPVLRSQGEGQNLEYMAEFPQQVRELGKEIAAFATSGGGRILVGVDDAGDLANLTGADTTVERDTLIRRIEGISHGTVKPAITPAIAFTTESNQTVLVIDVPPGDQPVYYSGGVPYVRHLTQSRPAEPHEVIQLVEAWLADPVRTAGDAFFGRTARALGSILPYVTEFGVWEDGEPYRSLVSSFNLAVGLLRSEAASDFAVSTGLADQLTTIANAAERVIRFERVLGSASREEHRALAAAVLEQARAVREAVLRIAAPQPSRVQQSLRYVREDIRELAELIHRLPQLVSEGRIIEIRDSAARHGGQLTQEGLFGLRGHSDALADSVLGAGLKLLKLQVITPTAYDGGLAREEILSTIRDTGTELRRLLEEVRC